MAYTPIVGTDPISPIENLINPRFVQAYADFSAIATNRAIQTYKWANAAARTAQAGMTEGDVGDQADTNQRWRYSGSAWVNITVGLFPVIPTTVGGTGVTLGSSGKVTFASGGTVASPVSVNGCFTSAFENYEFILTVTSKTAAQNVQMRLRNAGADISTASSYTFQRDTKNATSITTAAVTGASWELEAGGQTVTNARVFLFAPALARATGLDVPNAVGGPTIYTATVGGSQTTVAAADGFSLYLATGNMTGTLAIYGYNNN